MTIAKKKKKKKIRFSIVGLSHRLCRGVSGDGGVSRPTSIVLKGISVQEGSNGTRFDHGQFEIKTFLIYAPPYWIFAFVVFSQ